jgi:hypothetical protein
MVEVECPLCAESIDLGMAEEGAYECPYCEDEFYWEPDEFLDIEKELFDSDDVKTEIDWSENTILLGKAPASEMSEKIPFYFFLILFSVMTAGVFLLIAWSSYDRRQAKKKMEKMKEEYSRGVLNPEFLKGPGLLLYPNQECELLTEYDRPNHRFSSIDITDIHLELNSISNSCRIIDGEREWMKGKEVHSDIILNIEGVPTVTLTFGRKQWKKAERAAQKLSKLLDVGYEGHEYIWKSCSDKFLSEIVQTRKIK